MKLSIIIKTLNEEGSIARAIQSALVAAAPFNGEVIVADGGSTDETARIAKQYPLTLVQLKLPREQRCGIGPQLGYQHCKGEHVYIADGDMELDPSFIRDAVALLDCDPTIGGVGGIVVEKVFANIEFTNRARRFAGREAKDRIEVECLTGGGLYRRVAIHDVSYFSDRNLHGFEEYDLGTRLRAKGWRLLRLERRAVDHYSHSLGTYRLLWRRLRSGRLLALGEILRAGIDANYLRKALTELRPIRFAIGVLVYWPIMSMIAVALSSIWDVMALFAVAAGAPIAAMAVRNKSLSAGVYSVLVWHLTGAALLVGFIRRRQRPEAPISSLVLRTTTGAGCGCSIAQRGPALTRSCLEGGPD